MASKKDLEISLSGLEKSFSGDYPLQQYPTPSDIAAELLWFAFLNRDIADRKVADLGTGTGILAIGARMLGAEKVFAIEKDEEMVSLAKENAAKSGIEFMNMDVKEFDRKVDTVVMNPPFGKKPFHKDRDFLEKAFEISNRVYSIHTANSFDFLSNFARERGFGCKRLKEFDFPIRRSFAWHTKPVRKFKAVMLLFSRLERF
jgi:putative methylase